MDYSTFKLKNFFIKRGSTLPELKYPLTQQLREQYDITDEMLENVAVTFSMTNTETGMYRIANVAADIVIVSDQINHPDEEKYTLTYRFKTTQTAKSGRYSGEFIVDFLGEGNCGKITLPTNGLINILISDGITKTTVI
jgi:hypothetical protein